MLVGMIETRILEDVRVLAPMARDRLLRGFRNKEAEAEALANKTWGEWLSSVGGGEDDYADGADAAEGPAHDLYQALCALEQATLNLLAAGLYHLFEQHQAIYAQLVRWGRTTAVDLKTLPAWPKVDELRLVTNVAKHAEGKSAVELRKLRPDLFEDPIFKKLGLTDPPGRVRVPMVGEGLFVTEADLITYQQAIESLWESVCLAHGAKPPTRSDRSRDRRPRTRRRTSASWNRSSSSRL